MVSGGSVRSNMLTQRDVQAIVTLLRRLQRDFWPESWKYKQIDELIAKLRAAVPSTRRRRGQETL